MHWQVKNRGEKKKKKKCMWFRGGALLLQAVEIKPPGTGTWDSNKVWDTWSAKYKKLLIRGVFKSISLAQI